MLEATLLSAPQAHMRVYALEMAMRVAMPPAGACTRSAGWLLRQLAAMRPRVAANADRCSEFYALFAQVGSPPPVSGHTHAMLGCRRS